MIKLRPLVKKAQGDSPWDLGNGVLYALCEAHPTHAPTEIPAIVAKVWLIGRAYAASLDRRKNKIEGESNDRFYVAKAAPAMARSKIDGWIAHARDSHAGAAATDSMIDAHYRTTALFKTISDLDKRSLASKYLHFHQPNIFFIYDSRAAKAMGKLRSIVGRAPRGTVGDGEYRKFVGKCQRLRCFVKDEFDVLLSPRQLDNLLLDVERIKA